MHFCKSSKKHHGVLSLGTENELNKRPPKLQYEGGTKELP